MFTLRSFCGFALVCALIYWQYSEGKRLYAFMWWILAAKTLLKNPQILHPKRTKFKMIHRHPNYTHWSIAHRGGSAEAPENTL